MGLYYYITYMTLLNFTNFGESYSLQYFFSSLVFGFILIPVSQIISLIFGTALETVLETASETGFLTWLINYKPEFFTPAKYLYKEFAGFSIWIINNKSEKMMWEWELFYYNLYWGISTNALIFVVLTWCLKPFNYWLLFLFLILIIISLFRSMVMGALHKYCIDAMESQKDDGD